MLRIAGCGGGKRRKDVGQERGVTGHAEREADCQSAIQQAASPRYNRWACESGVAATALPPQSKATFGGRGLSRKAVGPRMSHFVRLSPLSCERFFWQGTISKRDGPAARRYRQEGFQSPLFGFIRFFMGEEMVACCVPAFCGTGIACPERGGRFATAFAQQGLGTRPACGTRGLGGCFSVKNRFEKGLCNGL